MSRLWSWGAHGAKWAAALVAATNAGRLNTPDTEAGPTEWGLYVALPALVAVAAGAGHWLTSPGRESRPGDTVRRRLVEAMVELLGMRQHDAAARVAEQLRLFDDAPPPQRGGGY